MLLWGSDSFRGNESLSSNKVLARTDAEAGTFRLMPRLERARLSVARAGLIAEEHRVLSVPPEGVWGDSHYTIEAVIRAQPFCRVDSSLLRQSVV